MYSYASFSFQEMLSILRPCDGVEQLYSQTVDEENFMAPPFLITG